MVTAIRRRPPRWRQPLQVSKATTTIITTETRTINDPRRTLPRRRPSDRYRKTTTEIRISRDTTYRRPRHIDLARRIKIRIVTISHHPARLPERRRRIASSTRMSTILVTTNRTPSAVPSKSQP